MQDEWERFRAQAEKAFKDGNFGYSETMWLAALQEAEIFGNQDPRLSYTLEGLGEVYFAQAKYRHAEQPAKRVLEIYEVVLGPDHIDVATAAQNLAMIYHWQQKYGQAEPLYKRAMSIKTRRLGPNHPDLIPLLEAYGNLLQTTHREAEASHLKVCAQGITSGRWTKTGRWNALPPPNQQTAQAGGGSQQQATAVAAPRVEEVAVPRELLEKEFERLKRIAESAFNEGRLESSEAEWKAVLKIAERLGGQEPRLAHSLDSLGEVLCRLEKYSECESVWKRSLQIKVDVLGPFHAAVSHSMNNLGRLHYMQGHYAEAETFAKRCIEIYEKLHGTEHPDVAYGLHNLATLYHVQGRYSQAEPLYKRGLTIRQRTLGEEHPETQRIRKHLGDLLKTTERDREASSVSKSATGVITGEWRVMSEEMLKVYSERLSPKDPSES